MLAFHGFTSMNAMGGSSLNTLSLQRACTVLLHSYCWPLAANWIPEEEQATRRLPEHLTFFAGILMQAPSVWGYLQQPWPESGPEAGAHVRLPGRGQHA